MRRWTWASAAIVIIMAILLGFLWWLISILSDSAHWCGVILGAGKVAGVRPLVADCTPVLLSLIGYLGWVALVMLGTFSVGFIVLAITDRGADIDVHGPGGIGLRAGNDRDDPPPSPTVTTTTQVKP